MTTCLEKTLRRPSSSMGITEASYTMWITTGGSAHHVTLETHGYGGNKPEGFILLTYIYLVAHLRARLGGFGTAIFWQEMHPKRERV